MKKTPYSSSRPTTGLPFPASKGVPLPSHKSIAPPTTARVVELNPDIQQELRAHVINLVQGRFSQEGWKTRREDVDTIFGRHLREWIAARPAGQKTRIMIFAHGGLVSEEKGLEIAARQLRWWKDNGVYPLFFVWESGFFETLSQLINPGRQRAFDLAAPTDILLEHVARGLGGGALWSGMKRSAERASDTEGGARYLAVKLAEFCRAQSADPIELHAVGHSAGSIFHAHFLRAARECKVPPFATLQLLAPAITVDGFKQFLLPLMKDAYVKSTGMFTMARPYELADNCAQVYRKSLLYLIKQALEPERGTPVLGLEESIRADRELMDFFQPDAPVPARGAQIIFSKTKSEGGRTSSQSSTHGGFDDDKATMESVVRRILDEDEIKPFPIQERKEGDDGSSVSRELRMLTEMFAGQKLEVVSLADGSRAVSLPSNGGASRQTKRALCIGIDEYPRNALAGCVNDARQWHEALSGLGFSSYLMLNAEATREAILRRIRAMISDSQAGDVIAIQYSGHGTQLPDLDGDEADSFDEALCPIDCMSGNFLIDDDLAEAFDRVPEGINVTVFTDCCHSGTITRFALGSPLTAAPDTRARFLVATPEMEAAHAQIRETMSRSLERSPKRVYERAREILFCACRANEVALESNGHGAFTSQAVPLLLRAPGPVTHAQFQKEILRSFGVRPKQHPELHCADSFRDAHLLGSLRSSAPVTAIRHDESFELEARRSLKLVLQDLASSL
jgi:Caspase domain